MGLFTILQVNFQDYCTLDQGAIKALSISHLYKLLDKCSTAIGSRLLNTWLLMPLKDKSHIESRLDIVQVLTEDPVLLQQLSSILKNFPDTERTATKFTRSKANLNDCVALYQALNKIPMIIQVLESCSFESEFQQIAEPLMVILS